MLQVKYISILEKKKKKEFIKSQLPASRSSGLALKLEQAPESPGGLLQTQIAGP